jgi:hypothetical protein
MFGVNIDRTLADLAAGTAGSCALAPRSPFSDQAINWAFVTVTFTLLVPFEFAAMLATTPTIVDLLAEALLIASATGFGARGPWVPRAREAIQRLPLALQRTSQVLGPPEPVHRPSGFAHWKGVAALLALGAADVGHVEARFAVLAFHLVVSFLELALGAVHTASLRAGLELASLAALALRCSMAGVMATCARETRDGGVGCSKVSCFGHVEALGARRASEASTGPTPILLDVPNHFGDVELALRAPFAVHLCSLLFVEMALLASITVRLSHGKLPLAQGANRAPEETR